MEMNWKEERNLTMLADYYEFTMSNGYFVNGMAEQTAIFDMFFRKIPDDGGFAVFAGLEQLINYIKHLKFTPEDIHYFREKGIFDEGFLSLNVIFGPWRRVPPCSPTNPSSLSAAL